MKRLTQKQNEFIYCAIMITWLVVMFSFIGYAIVKALQMYPINFWYR